MVKARLIQVARDVPQLENATFALTEWAANAATRRDLEKYFLGMSKQRGKGGGGGGQNSAASCPLGTVIRRVLLYCDDEQEAAPSPDPSTLTDGCAKLIATVLLGPACNNVAPEPAEEKNDPGDSELSSALEAVLGELLRMGRALAFEMGSIPATVDGDGGGTTTPEEVATNVSDCILELLRSACGEKRAREKRTGAGGFVPPSHATPNRAAELVRLLEAETDALASKLSRRVPLSADERSDDRPEGNIPSVLDLMARRDGTKTMADRAGAVLELSIGRREEEGSAANGEVEDEPTEAEADGGDEGGESTTLRLQHFQTSEAKDELVRKIMGPSLYGSVASCKVEVKSLEDQIARRREETSSERDALAARRSSVSTQREEIARRVDQLRKVLQDLEARDEQLAKEGSAVDSELGRLETSSRSEIEALEEEIGSKAEYASTDRAVLGTVDKIAEAEGAWVRSFTAPIATSPASVPQPAGISTASLAPLKLDRYLENAHSYFRAEAESIDFLRKRILSTEAEICELEGKLQPCPASDVCDDAEPTSDALATLKSLVVEDNAAIQALKYDVKEMRRRLIFRIEAYCKSKNNEEHGPNHIAVVDAGTLRSSHRMSLDGISIELTGIRSNVDADMDRAFSKLYSVRPAPPKPRPTTKHVRAINAPEQPRVSESVNGKSASPIEHSKAANAPAPEVPPETGLANGKPPPPAPPLMSWANKTNNISKKETKSFLDIQREEMLKGK